MASVVTDLIIGILIEGLIYGLLALGIYISYRVLDFADLSVDGTFPLGAAVATIMIIGGTNPWITLPVSFAAGMLAGMLTGILNEKLKIKDLLSGIIVMTMLYSVNYRIVGRPTENLINQQTIFTSVSGILPPALAPYAKLITVAVIMIVVKLILDLYLKTKSGFLLRSVGDNPALVVSLAKNPGTMKILGLALANGLVALSGAVNLQSTFSFNVAGGTGKMVMGLAAVIIGTTIFGRLRLMGVTTAVVIGMIIYKACISLALMAGFEASDLNLIISVLFVITLCINNFILNRGDKNA